MKYYIIENGNPSGPFEVVELIEKGLKGNDLVWTEGFTDWVLASNVDEIASAMYNGGTPSASQPQYPRPPYQQPPYPHAQGGYQPGNPYQAQRGYYQQPAYGQPPMPNGWQAQPQTGYEAPPKSWLAESIILTLCCCLPIGIYCIIKAASVNSLWSAGQYDAAVEASEKTKKWLIIGLVTGVVLNILCAVLQIMFMPSSMGSIYNSI
ncbi:MAG: CD225/dispanin family protein [Muribaculum sp.]|nr:CD225/dispanin family protein [Muribaculum sp.]